MPPMNQTSSQPTPETLVPAAVLTRALLAGGQRLSLPQKDLAIILGVSPASLSRLSQGRSIQPESKEGELALLVIRLFRSLDTLVGGDEDAGRLWFQAYNEHLGGVPAELVQSVQGLVHVVEYLDAMRSKL